MTIQVKRSAAKKDATPWQVVVDKRVVARHATREAARRDARDLALVYDVLAELRALPLDRPREFVQGKIRDAPNPLAPTIFQKKSARPTKKRGDW